MVEFRCGSQAVLCLCASVVRLGLSGVSDRDPHASDTTVERVTGAVIGRDRSSELDRQVLENERLLVSLRLADAVPT